MHVHSIKRAISCKALQLRRLEATAARRDACAASVLLHSMSVVPLLSALWDFVSAYCRQQEFKVTVPQPGTYTFAAQPTQVLAANESLPSSYGNIGSYEMIVTWPQPQSHD